MEWWSILIMIFFGLILLMITGMPIALCFIIIDLVGSYILWGGAPGLHHFGITIYESLCKFTLIPLPLFVLMGEAMFHSGVAHQMIEALDKWMGRLPGRLGLMAVTAGTFFSTMSGSTVGTTAMLGSVLTPEMEKRGYKKSMSIGPIIGSGGLAMLIPPSALGVLLASLAEVSIGKLLIAGIVPGLIIGFFYAVYIVGRCYLQPNIAPPYNVTPIPLAKKIVFAAKNILPMGLVIFMVLGFIFLGIASPSEAAATGALGCFILAAIYGKLTWKLARTSFVNTIKITVMVLMIIAGVAAFSQIMAFSGASRGLLQFVASLPVSPFVVILLMQMGAWALGAIMSSVAVMMIAVTIFMPIVRHLGFDPIWFSIILLLNLEMSQTTPPFGVILFAMKGVAPPDTTMGDIVKAGLPFLLCDLIAMVFIILFPALALWLPSVMR